MATTLQSEEDKPIMQELEDVVVRFAGDSGDGIQLTGTQFTTTTAIVGNDLATFPDFPAEIRAPAGTLPGVSGFQIHFSSRDVFTPGDQPDVLVAMNPAALKVNLKDLKPGGIVIVNTDAFQHRDLVKAGYASNPLEDGTLEGYRVFKIPLNQLTLKALKDIPLGNREKTRCKNFYALGLVYWLFSRPLEPTLKFIEEKFRHNPELVEANSLALKGGYSYGLAAELFQEHYAVPPARLAPGTYRNINGNTALAWGLVVAAQKMGLPLVYGSYPITPASDILHELARLKHFDVLTFQAEDEIAAVCAAIGASYGGALGVTASSGPGIALKGEAIGLAVMVELPLVVCNIQRAGPSTGMPTKAEQADLLQALWGRNAESPVVVLAPRSPADCFDVALEAARVAVRYMVPVFILSDGYLANGSEPWRLPELDALPLQKVRFYTDPEGFQPYRRDSDTLARPWAIPGTSGLEHRIGGIEKEDGSGNISYNPQNHQKMVELRRAKVERVAREIPPLEVFGPEEGELLCVGWGSTFGAIHAAVQQCQKKGFSVSQVHLRHLNPLPPDLGTILSRFARVLVPELNMGQLLLLLRARYLVDAIGFNKVQGQPFRESEIVAKIEQLLKE